MPTNEIESIISRHYAALPLKQRIMEALQIEGKTPSKLSIDDLAPIDEFHSRGRKSTIELARDAGIQSWMHVIDIGCGIGGPSRYMASAIGCRVVGVDLCSEYCDVAEMLGELTGLSHLASYRKGNAVNLPFQDQSFDAAWTQHASMNIAEKSRFYSEAARVLKPSGILAICDILTGDGLPLEFPVPWASTPITSFLATSDELAENLVSAGFRISLWEDETEKTIEWFDRIAGRSIESVNSRPGLHLLLGDKFPLMLRNQLFNLQSGRIRVIKVVAIRN